MHRYLLILILTAATYSAQANEGDPVAIVRTSQCDLSIQTMWDFQLCLTATQDGIICTGGIGDQTNDPLGTLSGDDAFAILDRQPNQPTATWSDDASKRDQLVTSASPNAIQIQYSDGVTKVSVDGVHIAYVPDHKRLTTQQQERLLQQCDVLVAGGDASAHADLAQIARQHAVKILVLGSIDDTAELKTLAGNRFAISADMPSDSLRTVVLLSEPIQIPTEYRGLIDRKEKACESSQQVFAKLSVEQLNFRPSNGSHTPRWNVEHMMGRELLFFSQIFHAIDPAIPVMDLNPKQMPPDYQARHADWDGPEEAMQMQRVTSFTRRFAYLLNDLDLNQKAPGSNWTPRSLLRQMERHYSEHTANVKKKFLLEDWPKQ